MALDAALVEWYSIMLKLLALLVQKAQILTQNALLVARWMMQMRKFVVSAVTWFSSDGSGPWDCGDALGLLIMCHFQLISLAGKGTP